MQRRTGIALTSAALSITLGVLVGAVVTIGNNARSTSYAHPPALVSSAPQSSGFPLSAAIPSSVGDGTDVLPQSQTIDSSTAAQAPASSAPVAPLSAGSVALTTKPATTTSRIATPRTTPRPSTPPIVQSTVRLTPRTTAGTTPTSTTSRPTPTTPTSTTQITTSSAPADPPAPGQSCSSLGAKGTAAAGYNVFCQRNFATGTLAWRAVANGGGCLNKQMTGIGVDGKNYACRAAGPTMDRWRPAG